MDKFSSKAAANPLPATNVAAGSTERDAQSPPAQSETHPPESAAAPSPPPEIAAPVEAMDLKKFRKFEAELPADQTEAWLAIAERLGFEDAVIDDGDNLHLRSMIIALLESERLHDLSRKHPIDVIAVMGMAFEILEIENPELTPFILDAFLAPDILAAAKWLYDNKPVEFHKAIGLGNLIN